MIVDAEHLGLVYRAAQLKYIRTAIGGTGARRRAGRFNRPDHLAVYVTTDVQTAFAEYQQNNPNRPRPCGIVSIDLQVRGLLDLRSISVGDPADFNHWRADWKAARDAFYRGDSTADCPSWRCYDVALREKCSGIIYPSTRSGGTNIVYYQEYASFSDLRIDPIDPANEIRDLVKNGVA